MVKYSVFESRISTISKYASLELNLHDTATLSNISRTEKRMRFLMVRNQPRRCLSMSTNSQPQQLIGEDRHYIRSIEVSYDSSGQANTSTAFTVPSNLRNDCGVANPSHMLVGLWRHYFSPNRSINCFWDSLFQGRHAWPFVTHRHRQEKCC